MLKKPEPDIFMRIRYLSKLLELGFNKKMEELGVTHSQGRLLLYICICNDKEKEITQSDIQNEFHLTKSTVSDLMSRMEAKGFIAKKQNGNKTLIKPTDIAYNICEKFKDLNSENVKQLKKTLTIEKYNELMDLLDLVIKEMKGETYVEENKTNS